MSIRTIVLLVAGAGLVLSATGCTGDNSTATSAATTVSSGAATPVPSGSTGGSDAGSTAQLGFAEDGAFPFQAALLDLTKTDDGGDLVTDDLSRLSCGGSLIDERHVLTAGHCFAYDTEDPPSKSDLRVVVGRTTLTSGEGQVRRVARITVHPDFENYPLQYDVAVITSRQAGDRDHAGHVGDPRRRW